MRKERLKVLLDLFLSFESLEGFNRERWKKEWGLPSSIHIAHWIASDHRFPLSILNEEWISWTFHSLFIFNSLGHWISTREIILDVYLIRTICILQYKKTIIPGRKCAMTVSFQSVTDWTIPFLRREREEGEERSEMTNTRRPYDSITHREPPHQIWKGVLWGRWRIHRKSCKQSICRRRMIDLFDFRNLSHLNHSSFSCKRFVYGNWARGDYSVKKNDKFERKRREWTFSAQISNSGKLAVSVIWKHECLLPILTFRIFPSLIHLLDGSFMLISGHYGKTSFSLYSLENLLLLSYIDRVLLMIEWSADKGEE